MYFLSGLVFLFFSIKVVTFFSNFFFVGFGSIEEGKWLPTVIPALVYIFKSHDKFLASYWRKSIPSPPLPSPQKSTQAHLFQQPRPPRSSLEDYIEGTPGLDS